MGVRGTNEGSEINRPVWKLSADAIKNSTDTMSKASVGLKATITEAIRELATNIGNPWSGST